MLNIYDILIFYFSGFKETSVGLTFVYFVYYMYWHYSRI